MYVCMPFVDSGGMPHRQCTLTGNAAGIAYVYRVFIAYKIRSLCFAV